MIENFRELGGIAAAGGRRVGYGLYYRAAELDFADEAELDMLNGLGLKAVFDFRDGSERTHPEIYRKIRAAYYNVPVRAENAKIVKLRVKPDLKTLLSLGASDVCEVYEGLPFQNPSYRAFFELIREGTVPILFHCTAGKDRTGVAAALLLTLLGADKETVIADYLRTQAAVAAIKKKVMRNVYFLLRGFVGKKMQPLFDAERAYIEAALAAVAQKYESIEAYFKGEYGYTDEDIEGIRERSLTVVF